MYAETRLKKYKKLVGQRARIKDKLEGYCSFLWNHKGTIKEVYGKLFLDFDQFAFRTREKKENDGMEGVYLEPDSFVVI